MSKLEKRQRKARISERLSSDHTSSSLHVFQKIFEVYQGLCFQEPFFFFFLISRLYALNNLFLLSSYYFIKILLKVLKKIKEKRRFLQDAIMLSLFVPLLLGVEDSSNNNKHKKMLVLV